MANDNVTLETTQTKRKYFIITNVNGNDIGEYGWIVEHNSEVNPIINCMIEVCEMFSIGMVKEFVPLSDLTEITEAQYEQLSELTNEGDDTTDLLTSIIGPSLRVGFWIILSEHGLYGNGVYSFKTEEEAENEAMRDPDLKKKIFEITSSNIAVFQEVLRNQWKSTSQI